ncbi:MAG: hypothetical protein J1E96_04530 [Ruminococcus sp.]|nr:hypothetical protein [Ruminococcus sp.]
MPIKFTDKHICEKCNTIFEWNYFEIIRNKLSDPIYFVDTQPVDKCYVREFRKKDSNIYEVVVFCPKCGRENKFEYKTK